MDVHRTGSRGHLGFLLVVVEEIETGEVGLSRRLARVGLEEGRIHDFRSLSIRVAFDLHFVALDLDSVFPVDAIADIRVQLIHARSFVVGVGRRRIAEHIETRIRRLRCI